MATRIRHKQLKTIRDRLGITQARAASMLGVSYPYLLSVETGQRKLSASLAGKIARTFGVARIWEADALPIIRNSKGAFVPFTKAEYQRYRTARPSFFIDGQRVTPTADDYAQCARALLAAAEEQGELRPVVTDFVNWFANSISSDAILDSLKRNFDRLFPDQRKKSAAFLALTVTWGNRVEDDAAKWQERKAKAAKIAKRKRGQARRK